MKRCKPFASITRGHLFQGFGAGIAAIE